MKNISKTCTALIALMLSTAAVISAQQPMINSHRDSINEDKVLAQAHKSKSRPFSLMPAQTANPASSGYAFTIAAGVNLPVIGSGTIGRLTKWTGLTSNNSIIGDTTIFEDKFGMVGIGTDTPTSKLTVQGMIATTLGGYKFPDGTVQTTAFSPNQIVSSLNGLHGDLTLVAGANIVVSPSGPNSISIGAPNLLTSIVHNSTLAGNGMAASPLGIADGGVGNTQMADGAVTAAKIAQGNVVKALNGLKDEVMLAAGSNITITPNGNTLTIASTGGGGGGAAGLQSISHDTTLVGDGTAGSPLGLAIPLEINLPPANVLGELVGLEGSASSVLYARNHVGSGVFGQGGSQMTAFGLRGSPGVYGLGGENSVISGDGVLAVGGNYDGPDSVGGNGVRAQGGGFFNFATGDGGIGVLAFGGYGLGMGHKGGNGIEAFSGLGQGNATDGLAGMFHGGVEIHGNFSVTGGGTKNFKIDHPLDPENKYLYHAAIESSEVLNIYSGNVTTDGNGEAIVALPEWFESINRDFRYQLTVVGTFAQAIVGEKIKDNRFTIKTNSPGVEVSWQVTGIRSDAAIRIHPFKIEEDKPKSEQGFYLSPEAYSQPEERGVAWARNPEVMRQQKEQRLQNQTGDQHKQLNKQLIPGR